MKVKVISKNIHSLTLGKEYVVVGIEGNDYRVLNDHNEPTLFSPENFEVIDSQIPKDWVVLRYIEDGQEDLYANPPGLGECGFYEDYFDEKEYAIKRFQKYIDSIGLNVQARPYHYGHEVDFSWITEEISIDKLLNPEKNRWEILEYKCGEYKHEYEDRVEGDHGGKTHIYLVRKWGRYLMYQIDQVLPRNEFILRSKEEVFPVKIEKIKFMSKREIENNEEQIKENIDLEHIDPVLIGLEQDGKVKWYSSKMIEN